MLRMKFLDLLGNLFGKKEAAQNVENTTEEVFTEADLMRCLALSKMKTVKIEAIPHENLPLTASKFIGTPYFPKTMEYPKDSQNQPRDSAPSQSNEHANCGCHHICRVS